MTPQLQQAIKLLAASNLEIETFIGDALAENPLLEAGSLSHEAGDSGYADDIPREEFTAPNIGAEWHWCALAFRMPRYSGERG